MLQARDAEVVDRIYEHLITRFLNWARSQEAIRAVIQVGSRVRQEYPADVWADADLMLYVTEAGAYLYATEWLECIAPVWMKVSNRTAGDDPELLVMFEGGYNVDFVFCPAGALEWLRDHVLEDDTFRRGACILLDRDGLATQISLPDGHSITHRMPSEADFGQLCDMFWYLNVYVARQLRRGELWPAKMREAQARDMLLRMLEWHAGAQSGWTRDTWHNGRYLYEWADPRALSELHAIFSSYEITATSQALLEIAKLFSWLARETAAGIGYSYAAEPEEHAIQLMQEAIREL
jgi:aminoglycoside 6-adenylyltransferase